MATARTFALSNGGFVSHRIGLSIDSIKAKSMQRGAVVSISIEESRLLWDVRIVRGDIPSFAWAWGLGSMMEERLSLSAYHSCKSFMRWGDPGSAGGKGIWLLGSLCWDAALGKISQYFV